MGYGWSNERETSQSSVIRDLIAMLDAHREEIATVWAHAIREQMPDTTYGQRPVKEISAYNQVGLDIVKELLLGTGLFSPEWSRPGQRQHGCSRTSFTLLYRAHSRSNMLSCRMP